MRGHATNHASFGRLISLDLSRFFLYKNDVATRHREAKIIIYKAVLHVIEKERKISVPYNIF